MLAELVRSENSRPNHLRTTNRPSSSNYHYPQRWLQFIPRELILFQHLKTTVALDRVKARIGNETGTDEERTKTDTVHQGEMMISATRTEYGEIEAGMIGRAGEMSMTEVAAKMEGIGGRTVMDEPEPPLVPVAVTFSRTRGQRG